MSGQLDLVLRSLSLQDYKSSSSNVPLLPRLTSSWVTIELNWILSLSWQNRRRRPHTSIKTKASRQPVRPLSPTSPSSFLLVPPPPSLTPSALCAHTRAAILQSHCETPCCCVLLTVTCDAPDKAALRGKPARRWRDVFQRHKNQGHLSRVASYQRCILSAAAAAAAAVRARVYVCVTRIAV